MQNFSYVSDALVIFLAVSVGTEDFHYRVEEQLGIKCSTCVPHMNEDQHFLSQKEQNKNSWQFICLIICPPDILADMKSSICKKQIKAILSMNKPTPV